MSESGYRPKRRGELGFPFTDLYINNDFRLKQIGNNLGFKNFANSSYKSIDIGGIYIRSGLAISSSGGTDYFTIGSTLKLVRYAPLTTVQKNALTPVNGCGVYDSDLAAIQDYIAAWLTRVYLEKANTFTQINKFSAMVTIDTFLNINDGIPRVFTNGNATPTVANLTHFVTNNTGATTITNFVNGVNGQLIIIRFNDSNTTIQHGVNILLSGLANRLFANDETLVLYLSTQPTSKWIQIGGVI